MSKLQSLYGLKFHPFRDVYKRQSWPCFIAGISCSPRPSPPLAARIAAARFTRPTTRESLAAAACSRRWGRSRFGVPCAAALSLIHI